MSERGRRIMRQADFMGDAMRLATKYRDLGLDDLEDMFLVAVEGVRIQGNILETMKKIAEEEGTK